MNKKLFILLPAIALLSACSSQQPAAEPFFADREQSDVSHILDAQAARGARADATLYPSHFSGDNLNSLGRSKLELMLQDNDSGLPATIYIAGPAASHTARVAAVAMYLADAGFQPAQFQIGKGPNPSSLHPITHDPASAPKPATNDSPMPPLPGGLGTNAAKP
jgi:hypothetical protein